MDVAKDFCDISQRNVSERLISNNITLIYTETPI